MEKLNYRYEYSYSSADTFGKPEQQNIVRGHEGRADSYGSGNLSASRVNLIIREHTPSSAYAMTFFEGFHKFVDPKTKKYAITSCVEDFRDHCLPALHKSNRNYKETDSFGGVFCCHEPGRVTIFNVGRIRVYRYNGNKGTLRLVTRETAVIGAQKDCPEVFIEDIELIKIPVGDKNSSSNTLFIICDSVLADTLGEEEMCRIIRENRESGTSDIKELSDKIINAATDKGALDIAVYVVNTWGSYDKINDSRGGRCWNRDCEEWSTCDGYGCPGGNWHDI